MMRPPLPIRTASAEGVDVRHPTPDLHSLQGAYTRNVEHLEQTAERLSSSGSGIGEEMRRLKYEQSISGSRRSSLYSKHSLEEPIARPTAIPPPDRSRNPSTSSYANSIVDVNIAARWGGYSPAGFVTSPAASLRSGSWSHASMHRVPSNSRPPRLTQMPEPVQEGRPLDSPLSSSGLDSGMGISRRPSQSSFAQRYDEIAGQIEQHLDNAPDARSAKKPPVQESGNLATVDTTHPSRPSTPPYRPLTAASTDANQQAELFFRDFDGVHYSPIIEPFVELDNNGPETRHASANSVSLLGEPFGGPQAYAEPPPGEDMVYYPAPVPRMLNLPKRLSKLPAASVQAQRR
ncbi:hypothetical protein LTR28_010770, partial [Elasticomyces elasticus]